MLIYKNPVIVLLFKLWQILCHIKCQNSKFVVTRWVLSTSKYTKIRFSAGTPLGELTTLPQTPYSAGEGDTPSHSPPLDAFGISILGAFGASLLDAFSVSIRAKPASTPPP